MIYEVRAHIFFTDENDAKDYMENSLSYLKIGVVVNPDQENKQGCSIELIKCYHDETPTLPCEVIGITTSP